MKPSEYFKKLDLSALDAMTSQFIREKIYTFKNVDLLEGTKEFEILQNKIESDFPLALGIQPKVEVAPPAKKKVEPVKVEPAKKSKVPAAEKQQKIEEAQQKITEINDMIDLLTMTLADNPKDSESQDMLELMQMTLPDLEAQLAEVKKMADGGALDGKYVYKFHEERGEISAYVVDLSNDKMVWEFHYPDWTLSEDERLTESTLVDDGFMKHWEDISGLENYLKDLSILPADAELVSEQEAESFKNGGVIKDQYKGYSESSLWADWTVEQRTHFLTDHFERINELHRKTTSNTEINAPEWATYLYFELPTAIKEALKEHKSEGSYRNGGGVGEEIIRNKNKNDWKSKLDFYLKYNTTPVGKGMMMEMAYGDTKNVDSAIPQSLWGTVDNTSFYVYDYTTNSNGELVDLREKLKFSNVKVAVTIVSMGDVLHKDKLPSELQDVIFHKALDYVFNNDDVEAFDIRPINSKYNNGGGVDVVEVGSRFYDTRRDKLAEIVSTDRGLISFKYLNKVGTEFLSNDVESLVKNQFDYLVSAGAYQMRKHQMAKDVGKTHKIKEGDLKVGDAVYTASYDKGDGESGYVAIVANSEEEAQIKANSIGAVVNTRSTPVVKIRDEEHLSNVIQYWSDDSILKFSNGGGVGEIKVGDKVTLPEIKMPNSKVQFEKVENGEVISIENGIYGVLNPKTKRIHQVSLDQIQHSKDGGVGETEIYDTYKVKKSKFNIGDKVYSWQNEDYPAEIVRRNFNAWESISKPHENDTWQYLVKLKDGSRSKWMPESSLHETKQNKYAKGGGVGSVDLELEKWVALDKVGKFKNSSEKSWYEGTLDKLMDKYELSDEEGNLGSDLAAILKKQKSGTSKKVSKNVSIKKTENKQPDTLGGWSKDIITTKRRRLIIASRDKSLKMKERYLSAARALKALANVTKDAKTKKIASNDAKYFFGKAK